MLPKQGTGRHGAHLGFLDNHNNLLKPLRTRMKKKVKKKVKRSISHVFDREKSRKNLQLGFFAYYMGLVRFSLGKRIYLRKHSSNGFDYEVCLIETYGFCNRQCSFCHNNPSFKQRNKGIMSETLYIKIIDELSELGFCGRISLVQFGEPFWTKTCHGLFLMRGRSVRMLT